MFSTAWHAVLAAFSVLLDQTDVQSSHSTPSLLSRLHSFTPPSSPLYNLILLLGYEGGRVGADGDEARSESEWDFLDGSRTLCFHHLAVKVHCSRQPAGLETQAYLFIH